MREDNKLGALLGTAFILALVINIAYSYQVGPNYKNVTVDTTVNITNSYPEILSVIVDPNPITLNAGTTKLVKVNATIRDFEGYQDIALVNATFYDANVANSTTADDNNFHYTNASCSLVNGNGFYANYTCHFQVWYYANNGSNWTVNLSVVDSGNLSDTAVNTSTINALLAINVTPLIDYGNLAVGDINDPSIEANVTNFGNVLINISVYGFGNVTGDGLAMVCEQRNISIDNERFDTNPLTAFASMNVLNVTPKLIPGLQLPQRTNDSAGGEVINGTYWRIRIPPETNPAGRCNGSVVFQAEQP